MWGFPAVSLPAAEFCDKGGSRIVVDSCRSEIEGLILS